MVERLSPDRLAKLRGDMAAVTGAAPPGPSQPIPS